MSTNQTDPSQKDQIIAEFRNELNQKFDQAIVQHEAKMTKLGFVFLAIFLGVIAIAALLP